MARVTVPWCTCCGRLPPDVRFGASRTAPTGRAPACLECMRSKGRDGRRTAWAFAVSRKPGGSCQLTVPAPVLAAMASPARMVWRLRPGGDGADTIELECRYDDADGGAA